MIGKKRTKAILDPKICFDMWIETGSVWKAPHRLKDEYGIFNKATGKLASPMGIWRAAWVYTLNNLPEARVKVAKVWEANGENLTDNDWYLLVIEKAKYIYSRRRFKKFIEEHLYLTPYV